MNGNLFRIATFGLGLGLGALSIAGCSGSTDLEAQARTDVKTMIDDQLVEMLQAAKDLQSAAPTPDADGWNATADAKAVSDMRAAWKRVRSAYEHVEGAIAVLFPELDYSTDARYDDFIADQGDDNLFDDQGVTGVHGIERILWADSIPDYVVDFESKLPGYVAAAFPANEQEARDFKEKLAGRLVADTQTMLDEFKPLALDNAAAFRGVIGSLQEQVEKVSLAATAEDESRYAQYTLADLRANLDGARKTFEAFHPLLDTKDGGTALAATIDTRFDGIAAHYNGLAGDAIPQPPAGWNPDAPTSDQLTSAYGKLWTLLSDESDADKSDSLVAGMLQAADLLGIPQLPN